MKEKMKLYTAPLEGITGYVFRNAFYQCFDHADKYFIPFISPNQHGHFSSREKMDVLPEHNQGMYAVPQILTNSAEDFLRTAKRLAEYGYREINMNLGCPSRTVVNKGRGAGFLMFPDKLERFLDEVFARATVEISIKTRLGMESPGEFERILEIYNRYPLKELIIHPRVQRDFYNNHPNMEVFENALSISRHPVCYNGDIFSEEDYREFTARFPQVEAVMLGRGLLMNPGLARTLKTGIVTEKERLRRFHDQLYEDYHKVMPGEKTILFKMKELWSFLAPLFTDYSKYAKKIKKAQRREAYEAAVDALFTEQELVLSENAQISICGKNQEQSII